jgi:hypothetical protein
MWFSSGGTKSVLHNDGLDNINCLLDGSKDLIMFHKVNHIITDLIPFCKPPHWREMGTVISSTNTKKTSIDLIDV